jgi:class 3 adenylate cyclase
LCALEISNELKNHPDLRVRMGIHSGPVNEVTDLNEQANIAGAGINIAQRVMRFARPGVPLSWYSWKRML